MLLKLYFYTLTNIYYVSICYTIYTLSLLFRQFIVSDFAHIIWRKDYLGRHFQIRYWLLVEKSVLMLLDTTASPVIMNIYLNLSKYREHYRNLIRPSVLVMKNEVSFYNMNIIIPKLINTDNT